MSEETQKKPEPKPANYLNSMLELMNSAFLTLNTQDLQEITIILQKGRSLYKKASEVYAPDEFELRIMEMCLLNLQATFLTVKAAYSKLEERFSQARAEYGQIDQHCTAGKNLITGLLKENRDDYAYALFFYHFLFSFIQYSAQGEGLEMEHEVKIEKGGIL